MKCRRTASLLPSFAQPYRLVLNLTIEGFVAGNLDRPDIQRWAVRLRHYWRRYMAWLPLLRLKLRGVLNLEHPTAELVWQSILKREGDLARATLWLTRDYGITMFGEYKCHLPNPP